MSELQIIDNKIERVLDTQSEIFKEIKDFRSDFSDQKISCENRFTKIEIKAKVDSGWKKKIYNVFYVIIGGLITYLGNWLFK